MSFSFLLSPVNNNSTSGLLSSNDSESTGLLSNGNDAAGSLSMLTATGDYVDAFAGKDMMGTPDFSNMDPSIASSGQTETIGSMANAGTETIGSMACAGAETVGSVACGGSDSGSCGGGSFSSVC